MTNMLDISSEGDLVVPIALAISRNLSGMKEGFSLLMKAQIPVSPLLLILAAACMLKQKN